MNAYDPACAPSPQAWLALSEFDRIDLVENFHKRTGRYGENLRLHSVVHVIVENQIALGLPPAAAETLSRLSRAGVSRHAAVHAIGGALAEQIFPALSSAADAPEFNEANYVRALGSIDARAWRDEG